MKYRLRAEVEGAFYLQNKTSAIGAERDDVEFTVESDEEGRVVALSVCARIPDEIAPKFRATASSNPDGSPHLEFRVDLPFHNDLLQQLQEMESLLAFSSSGHPLRRIRWHEAAASLVPESPEEAERVPFWNISVKRRPPSTRIVMQQEAFQRLVEHAPRFRELTIPIGFWREGMNQLERGEFVQAFYSHYFVIEGFFADGKTSERGVLKAFSNSEVFTGICEEALQQFFGTDYPNSKELRVLFELESCQPDVSGLQKFLFRMRGRTHHYSGRSSKLQATPFNQEQFRCVALLGMYLSTSAICGEVVAINRRF